MSDIKSYNVNYRPVRNNIVVHTNFESNKLFTLYISRMFKMGFLGRVGNKTYHISIKLYNYHRL